jgi:hypothetical protein
MAPFWLRHRRELRSEDFRPNNQSDILPAQSKIVPPPAGPHSCLPAFQIRCLLRFFAVPPARKIPLPARPASGFTPVVISAAVNTTTTA